MVKALDITGMKFGRLTALHRADTNKPRAHWLCACECGSQVVREARKLTGGLTKSCGCIWAEKVSNPVAKSPLFGIWWNMRERCENPKSGSYSNYGGRGIKVCERWMNFRNFEADMGTRPRGTSLDRIDNHGNYEPSNCRWATRVEQQNNLRTNRLVEFGGRTLTIAQWARETGLPTHVIRKRLNKGWSTREALCTPKSEVHSHGRIS